MNVPGHRYLFFVTQPYSFAILRPLQEAIRAAGGEAAWFLHDLPPSHLRPGERLLRSVAEVRTYAPRAVFVPGNWVPPFLPGVKVQVFHGFGIEKKGHFRIRGFFDLYCTHGPLTTLPFRELAARHGHFEVAETGWPKMDPLFQMDATCVEAPRDDRPLILFAPTFSPALSGAPLLVETVSRLVRERDWLWLAKFHPKTPAEWISAYQPLEGARFRISTEADIVPLLRRADVLLSDTSSVIAEFLMLDKPAVTFRHAQPGPHLLDVRNPDELEAALERALARPPELLAAARAFADGMHPWRDGRSSERVLKATEAFLAAGGTARLKPKPLNLWRRLQARWRMNYFLPD
ncbi:MAG TPA: CDP-glycerol glycerophosphotransferase family protein [Gammaproteobacteria bacterium]|nr:CDP-glycerol glycerophosphotransferase family protein [Gammaproteobacteria bacterium]